MAHRFIRAIMLTIACISGLNYAQAQGLSFNTEATFLRLHSSNGQPLADNATDYEIGQRYQLSYVNSRNLGTRISYWDWDHNAQNPAGVNIAALKTYNFDIEAFKRIDLTNLTNIELSGGLRYNDTTFENRAFGTSNNNAGFGGLFGLRGAVKTSTGGELYARSKWAVIMGNGTTFGALPNQGFDVVRNQWELGMGYQHNICLKNGILMTPHVGAEWITFTGSEAGIGLPGTFNDVALGGFVFGVGFSR